MVTFDLPKFASFCRTERFGRSKVNIGRSKVNIGRSKVTTPPSRRGYKDWRLHRDPQGDIHIETCYYIVKNSRCAVLREETTTTWRQFNQHLSGAILLREYVASLPPRWQKCKDCYYYMPKQQPLEDRDKLDPQQHCMFRTTVGQLIWASLDRPDLMYAAKLHSSRLQGPTERDLCSLKHSLRYPKGTTHCKLFIGRGLADYLPTNHNGFVMFTQNNIPLDLRCYTDSDWAGDKITRRSTSRWLCSLLGAPLSYASCTQNIVTLSSAEAELMALSSGMTEALHLRQLIEELQSGMACMELRQQKVHYSLHRQHFSYELNIKTGSEQEITTHLTTRPMDTRRTTSWRGGHTESHYPWKPCRHLH